MADTTRAAQPRRLRAVVGEEEKYAEFAPEFERALVYACCSDPRVWSLVGSYLEPKAMTDPRAEVLLKAAGEIARDTGEGPSSPTLVVQRLAAVRDAGKLRQRTLDRVCSLFDEVEEDDPRLAQPDQLIAEAARIVRARKQAALVQQIQLAHGKGEPLARFGPEIDGLDRIGRDLRSSAVMLHDGAGVWAAIEQLRRADRLPTGIAPVDEAMRGGLYAKTLHVWGAAANVGKTASMVHQCCFNWLLGKRVVYVPMEESVASTLTRAIAFLTGCTMDEVGGSDDRAKERLAGVLRQPGVGALAVEYLPQGASVAELRRLLDRVVKEHPEFDGEWDAVFVDYPDKMRGDPGERKYDKMGTIYDGLRQVAVDSGKWVVVGSQLKDLDGKKIPTIEDLRDSRLQGDTADSGVILWRPEDDEEERMYVIAKNRGPGAGQVVGPVPTELERGRIAPVGGAGMLEADDGW